MASNNNVQAIASGDLIDLVSSSGSATIYPTDDAILAVLQARFRADLPYTRVGATNLVAINPYKTLASVNNASAKEYEERSYKDTSLPMVDSPKPLQPHIYDLAARVYLVMRRKNESQALLARGITGSGKTSNFRLFTNQILRLSSHSSKEAKIAEQIKALGIVLDSFGNSKTLMNPNASRHSRYTELHFNERGRITGAKILTFGLDKSRLNRLTHEERSFHVFYQFIAGCTTAERDSLNIEDPSDYALLASSGTYRLPAGPSSDDSIAMGDLRAAMRTLGFKPKATAAIFSLLIAILLLGNLEFGEGDFHTVSAHVTNTEVLDHVSHLLGISSEDLSQALTNKTSYVRKELYTALLSAQQSASQRDQLVRDLYAILFAFVVETANHKLAPSSKTPPPYSQIVMLDQPGYQSRGPAGTSSVALSGTAPLISAYGQNGFDEFCINFADEMLQSYYTRHTFEDSVGYNGHIVSDGVSIPAIATMDNTACVEMLRGQLPDKAQRKPGGLLSLMNKASSAYKQGKGSDHRNEDLLQEMQTKFGVHASFVASSAASGAANRMQFGVNHYAGNCTYDVTDFVEKDTDLLDPAFVTLLRSSSESFVAKLFSGPSLAAEKHYQDESIVVQAQVSSRPLRTLTPIVSSNLAGDGERTSEDAQELLDLDRGKSYPVSTQINFTLSELFSNISKARLWALSCIRPNDSGSPNSFDKRRVKAQIRSLLLADLASRRSVEYVVDYDLVQFCDRYVPTMRGSENERITQCARANGWIEGLDYVVGHRSIWLSYTAWKMVEDTVRAVEKDAKRALEDAGMERDDEDVSLAPDDGTEYTHDGGGYGYGGVGSQGMDNGGLGASNEDLVLRRTGTNGTQYRSPNQGPAYDAIPAPNSPAQVSTPNAFGRPPDDGGWGSEWDKKDESLLSGTGTVPAVSSAKEGDGLVVKDAPNSVEEVPSTRTRRIWLWTVWACTWFIPSFLLTHVGRMKRPDVRLAWREKVTICLLIFLLNGIVIFYIVIFGRLLCPDYDNAWLTNEVAEHTADNDYFVAIQGKVYDVSNFVKGQHSDISGEDSNTDDVLEALAGQDLTYYFPVPLVLGCGDLGPTSTMKLNFKNFTETEPTADHSSGEFAQSTTSKLHDSDWYTATFQPAINQFHVGTLVHSWDEIQSSASSDDIEKIWGVYNNKLYDLTDYFYTQDQNQNNDAYVFLDTGIETVFKDRSGQDITDALNTALGNLNETYRQQNLNCLNNVFYVGETDYRTTARCQAPNITLIVVAAILMSTMVLKFLSALQLAPKRTPELQDKFVLCQVPCYTEGEDSLRRTIDSLAALNYDDKRKLIFIICDGNITGSGNDRTTPRIVQDILGVDPKLDPEPLMFKSVGEGARALNYGKVYSGLYEFEGHVVPYMVVVKVGKPTERSKPGNRGKRDSQILLMHYLNRVHFDAPMSPLELELYHQMRNVIGIDPAFYEYIFTVDADTTVTPESLNRLVASAAIDSNIIGICGETKVANEDTSWWTMIQVYEYYISHHLTKAFESLFGSVTCLPGCFSLYRIRTADKGRPIIISNRVIDEYAEPNVDTLHKKNLFSLGEDRFLTTLLMKHFPTFKTKFNADAVAHTVAPESTRVLFSQRRRWINSTVHNLCELVMLPELIGFCCFSMRIFVFVDLLSTIILPSTVVYLVYLIVVVSIGKSPFPLIAIIMIAAGYGLQILIFILKREFMLIGWMIVYLLSYPIYSFFLPVYSFWCMDEFGWGNTRLVIGEGKDKKVIVNDDDKFDESMIPLKKFSEYEAEAWDTGSRHSDETGHSKARTQPRPPVSRTGSPYNYQQGSQAGDYYRDTNLTMNSRSNPNLFTGSQQSLSNLSHQGGQPYAAPQLPFMPFSGGPGSAAGSDYGGHMPMGPMMPMGYQNTGSMYGMPMGMGMNPMMSPAAMDPRTTMMANMMTGGSFGGSQSGGFAPPTMPASQEQRPLSTFSMATTVNPFAGPSLNPNPSDDELFAALRSYLSTQDLMTVTKKTAREAMNAKFPKADLTSRKDFLNKSIDTILAE
ncbi:chitin synthase [Lentinula raphanica]|uniref:chitin synthase n=1 Tax=Lentinula raphanica TaxID=153919 RepID=A0AA38P4H0_9AGAR|nr:chitin synthase [Lentinula raphanica]KAJ3973224.1 chitin synthase [Lentinula raphanica]